MAVLLGRSTGGTTADFNASANIMAAKFTAVASGIVTRIYFHPKVANAGLTSVWLAIYSDSGGTDPVNRLGQVQVTSGHTGTAAFYGVISPGVAVTAGTSYWLALEGVGEQLDWQGDATGGYREKPSGGTPPNPWGSAGTTSTAGPIIWAEDEPNVSTLPSDDFNNNEIDRSLWVDNRGPVAVEDGSALIPCRAGTGCSFATTNNLNLTGTSMFGRFPAFPQTAGVTSWMLLAINPITSGNDYNSVLAFVKDGTSLTMRKMAAFVSDDVTITFDATNHKWWRIRESGGSIFWDTAPDAVVGDPSTPGTWTQQRTMANPFAVTALRMELKCNYNGAALQHEIFECSTLNTLDVPTNLEIADRRHRLVPGRFLYAIGSATTLSMIQAAAPNITHLILQAGRWDWGDAAKLINPKLKVFMYKDAAGISTVGGTDRLGGVTPIGGVGKTQADALGVNAYLHATSLGGVAAHPTSIMEFSDFPGNYLANIGHATYYDAWANNVITELKQGMWDGVFMDDMNPAVENHWATGPGDVAEYPSDATYAAAFDIFMLATTTRIRNAGFMAVANFGPFWGSGYVDRMDRLNRWAIDYLDISMDEFFIKWRDTTVHAPAQVLEQMANLRHVMSKKKNFLAVLPGQSGASWDPQFRFAMACGLLVARSDLRFLTHYDTTDMAYNNGLTTHPEQVPELGYPVGRYQQIVSGQFKRVFEKGEVHVNVSGSSKTATFDRPVYGSGLTAATSTSLATNAGLIVTYNPSVLPDSNTGIGAATIGSQTIGVRDIAVIITQIVASDSFALGEATPSVGQQTGLAVSDSATLTDARTSSVLATVADALTLSEGATTIAAALAATDALTQSDATAAALAMTLGLSVNDAAALTDVAALFSGTSLDVNDSLTLSDAVSLLSVALLLTETGALSDASSIAAALAATDSATQGDASSVSDATDKSATDSAVQGDTSSIAADSTVSDSAVQSDGNADVAADVSASDALVLSEGATALSAAVGATDLLTLSEGLTSLSAALSVAEALLGTDAASVSETNRALNVTDSWLLTDQASLGGNQNINVSDTLTQSEGIASIAATLLLSDSLALSETAAPTVALARTDAASLAEASSLLNALGVNDTLFVTDQGIVTTQQLIAAADSLTQSDSASVLTALPAPPIKLPTTVSIIAWVASVLVAQNVASVELTEHELTTIIEATNATVVEVTGNLGGVDITPITHTVDITPNNATVEVG